jgi:hypothetical protein
MRTCRWVPLRSAPYLRFTLAGDKLDGSDMRPHARARRGVARVADVGVTTPNTGTTLDEHVVAVINEVLEAERGSVLALVQLSAMATDALERHALVVTGGQAAQACIDLRAVLERSGAPVSDRVGEAAVTVQELDRLDDRYLAFGQIQHRLMERIESIPSADLDTAAQAALAMVHTVAAAHAAWALQRAHDFAASRAKALMGAGRPADGADEQPADPEPWPTPAPADRTTHDEPPSDHAPAPATARLPATGAGSINTRLPPLDAIPRGTHLLDDSSDATQTDHEHGDS